MTVTRCKPALAHGITGRNSPGCATAVREARILFAWAQLQLAYRMHRQRQVSEFVQAHFPTLSA